MAEVLRARGISVRNAECRLATFCLHQGYSLSPLLVRL